MRKRNVLLVEEDGSLSQFLREKFRAEDYLLNTIKKPDAAISYIRRNAPNVVIADLNMAGIDDIEFVRSITGASPSTSAIVIPCDGSIKKAMEALNAGAFSYIKKPYNKVEVLVTIEKAFEVSELTAENLRLKRNISRKLMDRILGTSDKIEHVRSIIEKVADTDSTVLILGESGTGKEIVARSLHFGSNRSSEPFVPINCGAIPEDLLESELFGHEKGAFTGAIATKIGRFEAANGGTVFLDEIGDMSPALQVKILRVLQEKEFERVGGRKTIKVDIRVLAATNQNLTKAIKEKKFREDLYYRLNVIPVEMPPLRERKEDIPVFIQHFLKTISKSKNKDVTTVSPNAMRLFEEYEWPGNVREMENVLERIVVLKEKGMVEETDLPDNIKKATILLSRKHVKGFDYRVYISPDGVDFNSVVDKFETDLIINALGMVHGVKKNAAKFLKLNRTTLIEKMKRKGLHLDS
ncbi:MAG: sigma-54-dependent transcriptional regulator [Thermodesulfobacteriota bacterium]